MTSDRPLVSIILPTYNREGYLRQAVESVLRQTYDTWELLVVDDGSTDGTEAYLAGLTDSRLRVLRRPHSGHPGHLRNQGMAAALGAWFAFLDSDDLWVPSKLERQITDVRRRGRRWGFAYHRWIDEAGRSLPGPAGKEWKHCDGWILREVLSVEAWIAMPTVIVERTLMDGIGGFDESLPVVGDYEAWVRLARGAAAATLPEALAEVRVHPASLSRERALDMHLHLARLYLRLSGDQTLAPHRSLCLRRYAEVSLALADHYRGVGRYREAIGAVGAALRRTPLAARAWSGLAKAVAHPLTPPAVLAAYRQARVRTRVDQPRRG